MALSSGGGVAWIGLAIVTVLASLAASPAASPAGRALGLEAVAAAQAKVDKKVDKKQEAADQAQRQELQGIMRLADSAMTGQTVPSDFPIQFQNDFLKAQGDQVWVPFTVTIDPAKLSGPSAVVYLRLAPRGMKAPAVSVEAPPDKADKADKNDKKKKDPKGAVASPPPVQSPYLLEEFTELKPAAPGQSAHILRGFGAKAGEYDLYIVVRDRAAAGASAKTAVLKQPIEVPNLAGELTTSSVVMAERVDTLPAAVPPDQQAEHPYAFGQTEIVPSYDHKFKKSQELIVLVQIYNPTITPDKKFDLEATYGFYRLMPEGEKYYNSTAPQAFNPGAMGPAFDPTTAERSIQAGQGIPLQSFPEGNYRLEIKVTDKLSGKSLTRTANFTVTS